MPAEANEFINRYNRWREAYSHSGHPTPQAPVFEDGRLLLRYGYPFDGWSGFVIEPCDGGYALRSITTERRNGPLESPRAFFSDFELAGKYMIWLIGGDVRVNCGAESLEMLWGPSLAAGVTDIPIEKFKTRYELTNRAAVYMIINAGGIQPENRLLVLSYDALDQALEDGLPDSVVSVLHRGDSTW